MIKKRYERKPDPAATPQWLWWMAGLLPFAPARAPVARSDLDGLRGCVGNRGARTSFLRTGRRKAAPATVLLIHGTGLSACSWGGQLRGLASELDVVAVDLPGHGASDMPDEAGMDEYVDAAIAVLDGLDAGPVMLAGHSLGGAVAIALAARRPERIDALLLISSCAKLPQANRRADDILGALPLSIRDLLVDASTRAMLGPRAKGRSERDGLQDEVACTPEALRRDIAIARSMDLEDVAAELRLPVRILCGSEDRATPVSSSQGLFEIIPRAQLEVVQGAGHMLHWEHPERVNEEILEFAWAASRGQ